MNKKKLLASFASAVAVDTVRLGKGGRRAISLYTKKRIASHIMDGCVQALEVADVLEVPVQNIYIMIDQLNAGDYDMPEEELKSRSRINNKPKAVVPDLADEMKELAEQAQEVTPAPSNEIVVPAGTVAEQINFMQARVSEMRSHINVDEINEKTLAAYDKVGQLFDKVKASELLVDQLFMSEHGRLLTVVRVQGNGVIAKDEETGKEKRILSGMSVFIGR
ncbi:MAG: hypothetical protein ACRDCE_19555 [Cetobacterium sp.]|uniref:hypothetical protein n=1 Tax=Cetobacterium sp. TaxID=2071632 RepID=UPI003EE72B28